MIELAKKQFFILRGHWNPWFSINALISTPVITIYYSHTMKMYLSFIQQLNSIAHCLRGHRNLKSCFNSVAPNHNLLFSNKKIYFSLKLLGKRFTLILSFSSKANEKLPQLFKNVQVVTSLLNTKGD